MCFEDKLQARRKGMIFKMKKPKLEHKMEEYITYLINKFRPLCFNEKPVILHSIRVANNLYELGYDSKIVLGALLHDVVEDSSITIENLRNDFDDATAKLVDSLTEDKSINDKVLRNKNLIDKSVKYGFDSLIIKCADILDNSQYHCLIDPSNKELNDRLFKKYEYFLEKAITIKDEPIYKMLEQETKTLKEEMGD